MNKFKYYYLLSIIYYNKNLFNQIFLIDMTYYGLACLALLIVP